MQTKISGPPAQTHDYAQAAAVLIRSRIAELSPAEFKLCACLYARMKDEGGRVQAGTAELAAATGLSCRTVQTCRKQLVNKGFLLLRSAGCERSVYDLPQPVPPAAEPSAGLPAEGTQTELSRIAWLVETLSGNRTLTAAAAEIANGCTSTLLLALESMAKDGHRFDPDMPELFLSAVSHRVHSMTNTSTAVRVQSH